MTEDLKKRVELRPCPFCDSEEVLLIPPHRGHGMSVGCNNCGADIMRNDEAGLSAEKAIAAWNKRAAPLSLGLYKIINEAIVDKDEKIKALTEQQEKLARLLESWCFLEEGMDSELRNQIYNESKATLKELGIKE